MSHGLLGRTTPSTTPPKGTQWTRDGKEFMIWAEDIGMVAAIATFAYGLPLAVVMMGS